jgi:hypothetical protein
MTRSWVSRKINDAEREPHWTDAIAGLPVRGSLPLPLQHRTDRKPRSRLTRRWLPKGRFLDATLEIGSEVIVEHELGELASDGMRGLAVEIEDATPPRVRVAFASGYVDWFEASDFIDKLHLTGRTLPGLGRYRAGSDADVRRDLATGILHFRFPG